ncbi:MAG: phosphatase PAP2 family protein [Anaerolineales bacterium]|nr:phosphatase PAP2 family protein [Anaerolineales bacterium]
MISHVCNARVRQLLLVLTCVAITAGCASFERQSKPAVVPEIRPGILAGYLEPEALPNSLALLPPPPAAGSAALALDEEVSRQSLTLGGTPRWELATEDASLMFPQAAGTFSCAMGVPITEQDTPHLYMLLRRTLADAGLSTYTAKNHYNRTRPFVVNQEPTCTPDEEPHLMKDGSYPSGHTALGWAWALILSEIAPDRADTILARGRAFGESRVICNVHWHSDVVEGRFIGAAAVARLHADPTFRAELEAAKAELAAVRAKGLEPTRDCQAETDALAHHFQPLDGETEILQSWQGDYPVSQLNLLPEKQREQGVGFIDDVKIFERIWKAFKPAEAVPQIDFKTNLVLFARNTQFYNRIRIGKVNVTNGVAEVLAMETMSAMPIEDKVAMSMVMVPRQNIKSILTPDGLVVVSGQNVPRTYVYKCGDGFTFTARTEEEAWLFLPDTTIRLPRVPSASGTKYREGQIMFWSKGDEAMLELGEEQHANCTNNRAKAIWEDARLRGVDFRAVGNEPGWHLEVTANEKIVFVGDYGNTTYAFVKPEPLVDQHTSKTVYRVQEGKQELTVVIQARPCRDSMSGEPFEASVTVILDDKKYRGCGKAMH